MTNQYSIGLLYRLLHDNNQNEGFLFSASLITTKSIVNNNKIWRPAGFLHIFLFKQSPLCQKKGLLIWFFLNHFVNKDQDQGNGGKDKEEIKNKNHNYRPTKLCDLEFLNKNPSSQTFKFKLMTIWYHYLFLYLIRNVFSQCLFQK